MGRLFSGRPIMGFRGWLILTGNPDGLDQYVPDLTIQRIPDGSHWVIHEQPEVVNAYIRDFIASKANQP